eukprot:7646998-Alexandrium_andersonii.AAC.1
MVMMTVAKMMILAAPVKGHPDPDSPGGSWRDLSRGGPERCCGGARCVIKVARRRCCTGARRVVKSARSRHATNR